MSHPIVLIPARMAATRLPGKPLADIGGVPMIVQVWRRATEAAIGPVVVATDGPEIVAAVEAAGGRAVLTGGQHPSGSDRIFEALGRIDRDGRHDVIVNVQGDLPTIEPAVIRAALVRSMTPKLTSRRSPRRSVAPRRGSTPTSLKWLAAPSAPIGCGHSISRVRRRRSVKGHSIITSGSMLTAAVRSKTLSPCRHPRSKYAKSSSNCARSKPACGSMSLWFLRFP